MASIIWVYNSVDYYLIDSDNYWQLNDDGDYLMCL
jgi:hypothetical protein